MRIAGPYRENRTHNHYTSEHLMKNTRPKSKNLFDLTYGAPFNLNSPYHKGHPQYVENPEGYRYKFIAMSPENPEFCIVVRAGAAGALADPKKSGSVQFMTNRSVLPYYEHMSARDIEEGDCIFLQISEGEYGPEGIEYQVVKVEGDRALVVWYTTTRLNPSRQKKTVLSLDELARGKFVRSVLKGEVSASSETGPRHSALFGSGNEL